MSIKATKIQVFPMRGMDQRWVTKPNRALKIEDMTWNAQDAWKRCGGFDRAVPDYNPSILTDNDTVFTE